MTVPAAKVREAFDFFLGRPPNPETPPQFATVGEMYGIILNSPEFRSSPRARKTDLGWPLGQVFVSHPAKVLYCPIGKNACTFLKRQMVRISGLPHSAYILPDIHVLTDRVRTGVQLADHEEAEARRVITDPGYFKFAVLRDPAERLLSAYIEKFVVNRLDAGNRLHTAKVVLDVQGARGFAAPDFDHGISFRDFVEHVIRQPPKTLDPHWCPQHLYLQGIAWDRFFTVERINDAIDILEERSGQPLARQPENSTGSGDGELQPGAAELLPGQILAGPRLSRESYYDTDLAARVAAFYRADLDLIEDDARTTR